MLRPVFTHDKRAYTRGIRSYSIICSMNLITPDLYRTEQFTRWFDSLKDHVAKKAVRTRLTRMASGNFGDCKKIGNISEARVNVGPGYRIYFTIKGRQIILLLAGGNKSTQAEDIRLAQSLAAMDIEL